MTPRLARALAKVLDRDYATENEDFVFASEDGEGPVSERSMRNAFKLAQQQAGLKPIKMGSPLALGVKRGLKWHS